MTPGDAPGTQQTERITAVRRDGLTFGVIDSGPTDGHPVVLLHGFPQGATAWAPTTDRLDAAGFRSFALDQRGYAAGARPRGRRQHRMAELVADVAALVAEVGQPVTLVGHDWGAAVAWSVAMRRPDLVDHLVAASVPHPAAFFGSMVRSRQPLMSWYIGLFQLPRVPELLTTRHDWMAGWLARSGMSPEAVAAWRRDFLAAGCLPGALGWYRGLPFLEPDQVRIDVTVPTTFLWSDGDFALGRHGAERTAEHVAAPYRYVELTGHSHWLLEEAPDVLAEEIVRGRPG